METKKDEVVIKTSNLDEMKGKYLSEKLRRSWKEDFADEDTGEVVSIERHELLMDKGTYLSSKEISEINFFLQSGDIKEVAISNQKRGCLLVKGFPSVWVARIKLNNKARNIYLYSDSLELANQITIDYVEQKYEGSFKFISIKELEYSNLISLDLKEDDMSEENDYYKMEIEVTEHNETPIPQTYIINATNAESAKESIIEHISLNDKNFEKFDVVIISAKTISCDDIVDASFSKNYLNIEEG